YAAHQLNLQPRVSLPETSPTLLWTGKVGDASLCRVWGSRALVRDLSAAKLSPRAVPCVFLGFPPDAPGWQFYHPTSRRVLSSQDVTFDESVPYYRLFPYRTASLPPPPLFLAPGPPPVDPLPPQGPAPSGVSQVDAVEPVEVLQRFDFTYSSPQATPLSTRHSLSALPSDESVEPSGPYPELVGCRISSCEAEIYAGAMAAQELRWLTYLLTDLGEQPHSPPVLTKHIALRYFLARERQQRGQLRLAYVASEANTADIFTKALAPGDHQRFCTMLACFALLDWSCDLLFSPTLPMGVCQNYML
ncbi:unnamed protein product, partial [Closterium sp. NIES-53]